MNRETARVAHHVESPAMREIRSQIQRLKNELIAALQSEFSRPPRHTDAVNASDILALAGGSDNTRSTVRGSSSKGAEVG